VANVKFAKPASPPLNGERKEDLSDATTNIEQAAMQTVTSMHTMDKRARIRKERPRKQSLSIQQKEYISQLNNTSNLQF